VSAFRAQLARKHRLQAVLFAALMAIAQLLRLNSFLGYVLLAGLLPFRPALCLALAVKRSKGTAVSPAAVINIRISAAQLNFHFATDPEKYNTFGIFQILNGGLQVNFSASIGPVLLI
jgi:hypothetical protein